jgi:hypothetical protein
MKRLEEPYHRFTQDFDPASELGTHRKEGTANLKRRIRNPVDIPNVRNPK